MIKKPVVINLYGGPGVGKSTTAAGLYSLMKSRGYKVELVREWIKNLAYDDRHPDLSLQLMALAKQYRAEAPLHEKVDYIITDSPLLLNAFYTTAGMPTGIAHDYIDFVDYLGKQTKNIHYFVERCASHPYEDSGRYQTKVEAENMDDEMYAFVEREVDNLLSITTETPLHNIIPYIVGEK